MIYASSFSDHFSDLLTEVVLSQYPDPAQAADVTIILPTRRACRTIRETFLKKAAQTPLLLPKLMPLYELSNLSQEIPPACSALVRTLLLARLTRQKPNIETPAAAVRVAAELGTLLDEFYQYEVPAENLKNLAQSNLYAKHWNQTVSFLDIIRTYWPRILSERAQIDGMDRTVRLIDGWTQAFMQNPVKTPVIIAGFDGAFPAVQRFIKTLASFDNSLILMDGFDFNMSKEMFDNLPATHFLYPKVRLLKSLGLTPQDVLPMRQLIQKKDNVPKTLSAREQWVINAFMPEAQTSKWHELSHLSAEAMKGVSRIEAQTPAQEALSIALIMRKVLETPGKTAALVTTDRTLSRRVISEMKRWHIELNDTAGVPLAHTPTGLYLTALMHEGATPSSVTQLTLFKNPLATDQQPEGVFNQEIEKREFQARKENQKLSFQLKTDLTAFQKLFQSTRPCSFKTLIEAHIGAAEALASSDTRTGAERLWCSEDGRAAYELLMELIDQTDLISELTPQEYTALMTGLFLEYPVRPRFGTHPRLSILGPIEARLAHPDVCIIGGLNEGVFPAMPETGPWLNRPMRMELGLPVPELKIAALAADFAHCMNAPCVFLTRSLKTQGTPSIPSRFLSRLETVLKANQIVWPIETNHWIPYLETPATLQKITRPTPCPPVAARPRRLSATRVELWMRNPYAIYARYILNLKPLPNPDAVNGRQLYGICIHAVLERFFKDVQDKTDLQSLLDLGEKMLADSGLTPSELAFFRPQFEKTARFIIEQQTLRRALTHQIYLEQTGSITLERPGGPFVLTATADRIDFLTTHKIEIIDYKTGQVPSAKEIRAGFAPQLPLEGLILREGGFKNMPYTTPEPELTHWRLTGRGKGGVISSALSHTSTETSGSLIQQARQGLERLIDAFDQPDTPYEATPVPGKAPRYDDYAHLSRAGEWMSTEDDTDA